jgi:hypothetical protein
MSTMTATPPAAQPTVTPPAEKPMSLIEASRLELLDPATLSFAWKGASLRLTIAERASWPRVSVQRCFPLSKPVTHLSVRDPAGKEVGVLVDPAKLDGESRAAVDRELARRYLITPIVRILAVEERFGVLDWTVESVRGRASFTTRNARESVVRPQPNRLLLTDVEGNRWEIRDTNALDQRSAAQLLLHL